MHYIIEPDRSKYVYMCDIDNTQLVFALERARYKRFRRLYAKYELNIRKMPSKFVIELFPLTMVKPYHYELTDLQPVQYPIKKIYFVVPLKIRN